MLITGLLTLCIIGVSYTKPVGEPISLVTSKY